jgi:hypothetical protein
MTQADFHDGLRRVAFVDFEASSLGSASFPTEIGWAVVLADGSVKSGSCLIKPTTRWTVYANASSAASERLTGITRGMLDQDGLPPREALQRFLEAVGDRDLFSDEPDYDAHWLNMLAEAAGTSIGTREIRDAKVLTSDGHIEPRSDPEVIPKRHRAESDARNLVLAALSAARAPR